VIHMNFVNDDCIVHDAYVMNNGNDHVYNVQRKVFNVNENQMKQIKGQSIDVNVITRMYGEIPSQEEIRRRIREKDWNTYQKKKKNIPPQNIENQVPQRAPKSTNQRQTIGATKEPNIEKPLVSTNSEMRIDLTHIRDSCKSLWHSMRLSVIGFMCKHRCKVIFKEDTLLPFNLGELRSFK
jgi:hypothetical protein